MELFQNYPNPFNPETVITYLMPKTGHVTIKIFDLLGKEIVTLINENEEAGLHRKFLNAKKYSLPSGIYIYRMQAFGFASARKMLLIK